MDGKCATFKKSLRWSSYGLRVCVCACAVFLSSKSNTIVDLPKFTFCVGDGCVFIAIYHQLVQKCTTTAVQRKQLLCISSAARTPWKEAQGLQRATVTSWPPQPPVTQAFFKRTKLPKPRSATRSALAMYSEPFFSFFFFFCLISHYWNDSLGTE